ncbi:ABC transporter ATP-binding protein [Allorhodopirellula solitaria]|uniref:ABC transporter ATP-binding protein YtrB n=1 Tax=Allorhodopirellula solitaria TaxID=2527987 RepID=A0A5C5XSY8_9BACT|nr:ABC transporter ATP-binding protein [Allorhodopirellula solitaria]TWT66357.1 ABC transporter ATP-binding protein YtrB [Allorhodopirellula solitaria]
MTSVITAEQLTMRFRGCDALRGVDFTIEPGSVFALLGENGAGKTTMIRIMTGFQKPTSGQCTVCGLDPTRHPLEVRRRVGYVSDSPALYDWMSVGEIGWFTASFFPKGFLEYYRESIRRYEIPEDRKIRHLSKGQRAKVALSLALAHDPELLILDEPTSGLDPMVRRDFLESMIDRAASGRTVFLSSHQISEVERVADTIAILHEGKLRIVAPLNELKQSMTELTVSLDDPLVAIPTIDTPAEVMCDELLGRQRRLVVRDFTPEMHTKLASATGVTGVSERPLSLEEIFIACTKGSLSRPASAPESADETPQETAMEAAS